nr:DNA repair protein RadA [Ipomoea batatas]GMD38458.1 DNA repair protein RadA [Ipomoea batatas]GMD89618.1 DNA repair protein RadA [Ipomoea batatas]
MIPVTSDLRPPTPSEQPTGGVRRSATTAVNVLFFSLLASTAAMACVDLRGWPSPTSSISHPIGHRCNKPSYESGGCVVCRVPDFSPETFDDRTVLTKQAGLKLQGIFLNVISGFKLTETAGDLAMAAASCRIHKTQVEIWDLHIL